MATLLFSQRWGPDLLWPRPHEADATTTRARLPAWPEGRLHMASSGASVDVSNVCP
jgi:hypothetical protein